jgi:hypothetical protein
MDGASSEEIQQVRSELKNDTRALEALEPGSGSYFNEVRDTFVVFAGYRADFFLF